MIALERGTLSGNFYYRCFAGFCRARAASRNSLETLANNANGFACCMYQVCCRAATPT